MSTSNASNCFCNFIFDCNLTQHVSEPTHVKGNLLDMVLSSASVVVNRLTVYPLSLVDFSDHHAISFDFCCSVSSLPKCKPGYVYDFCNTDYESISSFLLDSNFSAVFDSSNIEFIWFFIKSLICKAMSLYIPRILVKRHQGPKWFNSNIRHHLVGSAETGSPSRGTLASLREASTSHLLFILTIYLLSQTQKRHPCSTSIFIQYLPGVQLPPSNEMDMPSTTLSDICISELDVFRVLRSLDVTKAKGCDGISPKLLKICALSTSSPSLFPEFITEISSSRVAHSFNQTYIHKSSIRNYRPISLLSVVSKVLEKLVFNSILDFVSDSISVSQFGFLRGRSTLQQMLTFFNTLLSSASQTDVIYLTSRRHLILWLIMNFFASSGSLESLVISGYG